MKIRYRSIAEHKPVEVSSLRKGSAYSNLIEKRNHNVDRLVQQNGCVPQSLLFERPCPNCGGSDFHPELKKDHLEIVRCSACDLVFTNPLFDENTYLELYQTDEYSSIVKELNVDSHNYRVERFGRERVEAIRKASATDGTLKLLDVGCNTGFFVQAAAEVGWDALGIDLNEAGIEFGRQKGLNLKKCDLFELGDEKNSFDVITLFDVLEHLTNPREVLIRAHSLLKTGGLLYLYVPNYDSASRYLMGHDAHFIWPSHHLTYFTPITIKDFCERNGEFELISLETEGLDLADYIWHLEHRKKTNVNLVEGLTEIAEVLQAMVNAGGHGKNLRAMLKKV